jgi:hypothetical protein
MAEVSGGALQTLISTLQNTNTQLGHIIRAIQGASPLPPTEPVLAQSSLTLSAIAARTGGAGLAAPLPDSPEGYITVDIPGVGPRLIPYYPV